MMTATKQQSKLGALAWNFQKLTTCTEEEDGHRSVTRTLEGVGLEASHSSPIVIHKCTKSTFSIKSINNNSDADAVVVNILAVVVAKDLTFYSCHKLKNKERTIRVRLASYHSS
ncbi:hypothetical protein BX616_009245 [Lobosporangium transversale]|nr:hypothetical protein BX616_009245 [Lobosporangium transversale]